MRDLARPDVIKSAAIATSLGALAACPRILLWPKSTAPAWYLISVMLLGGFVLWAFVFAWHTRYTNRPVFNLKPALIPSVTVTAIGLLAVLALHLFLDPHLRVHVPEDYQAGLGQWFAATLFSLAFSQLFQIFAPFDWSMRPFNHPGPGILFTTLFGVFIVAIKPIHLPPTLFGIVLLTRAVTGFVAVWIYARHGMVLTWWWGLLLHLRYLLESGS